MKGHLLLLLLLSLLAVGVTAFPENGLEPSAEPEPYAEPEPSAEPSPSPGPPSEGQSGAPDSAVVISAPSKAVECRQAGGECLPRDECPNADFGWNQPYEGICPQDGYECCFKDITQHSMECGVFGGDCIASEKCGAAPRHANARCARSGHVCCIWLV